MTDVVQEVQSVYGVVRDLIDGLFRVGGIVDTHREQLISAVNAADPAVAEATKKEATTLSDTETAELDRLLAKQHAAETAAAEPPAPVATPGGGFSQAAPEAQPQ
jgi:hypothetical protein